MVLIGVLLLIALLYTTMWIENTHDSYQEYSRVNYQLEKLDNASETLQNQTIQLKRLDVEAKKIQGKK